MNIFVNKWALSLALLASAAGSSVAFAQEGGRTQAMSDDVTRSVFQSPVTVTPRVGVLGFSDATANYTSRGIGGFTLDWDAGDLLGERNRFSVGLETGFMFSHLGAPGSNYFGTDSDVSSGFSAGANSFLVPAYITAGYEISDRFLVSGLFGANLLYRNIANSMQIGRDDLGTDSSVDVLPSLGLNVGWGVSRSFGLSLRGEYIPVPLDDSYTASIGAVIGLG